MKFMPKLPEIEPRIRPSKSRKSGRKKYAIEYRIAYDPDDSPGLRELFHDRKRRSVWSVWKRYSTEKQRDTALRGLQTKGPHKFSFNIGPVYEYRKEPDVKFRPLHDNIVVEYDDPKAKTDGGIILPDIAKVPSTEAFVIQTGPGRRAPNGEVVPVPCKPGDKVLVTLGGHELQNPDPDSRKVLRLITPDHVLAVRIQNEIDRGQDQRDS